MKNYISKLSDITLLIVASLTIMVGCVIVPGLPTIAKQLDVESYASWLVTVPSLGVVIFGPIAGRLIQQQGLYKSLCYGLFFYGLFGIIGIFLQGPILLLIDRLFLGGATVLIMSSGTGLISVFHEGHERLKMIAKQGMAIELGGVIFLFVGGLLATLGWQYPFFLYLISWLVLIMTLIFVPNIKKTQEKIDNSIKKSISSALKLTFIVALFSMIIFFTAIVMLPQTLHTNGWNEARIGYLLSFVSLIAVFAAALMPKLTQYLSEYKTLFLGFTCYCISHVFFGLSNNNEIFILGGFFLGIGFGLTIPLVNHMTIEQSHPNQRGRYLTYLAMSIFSGQFLASFMTLIPTNETTIFLITSIIAIVLGILMLITHIKYRKKINN